MNLVHDECGRIGNEAIRRWLIMALAFQKRDQE